ncbi:MAG: hypothetical protein SRB2_02594 [Desulfobacteraceae bacterium Eth-SRB2]|nr:MAG: hypothetical protein SRB2_02594 [Desulfobacteraceae bacterium Eth-SRB2]
MVGNILISFFYTLNVLLFLLGVLGIRLDSGERLFSIALVQTLLGLPLLAGGYLYLAFHLEAQAVHAVLFSEIIFALIWISMALRLCKATTATHDEFYRRHFLFEIMVGAVVTVVAGYFLVFRSGIEISAENLVFPMYGPAYFSAVFILMAILYASWRLEQFWRSLDVGTRWEYKFLVVGSFLVCGALAWNASYRLTFLIIIPRNFLLLSALLFTGWILMSYAVVRHRLLNRKIFVSRKVVYSFVVPSLLGAYLLGFGMVSLIMRAFGLEMAFVLKWLFVALGFVAAGFFALSGKLCRRVHFFISTHFYVNKYEYRDEWLALSRYLQGALTENDVVKALHQVLTESLYTREIFKWLGDTFHGYRLVCFPQNSDNRCNENTIAANDPLVQFFQTHSHFYLKEKNPDPAWQEVIKTKEAFLTSLNLTLLAPILIGDHLLGLIGLGPEFTGGQYGHDDFDLLAALGTQSVSVLLAVQMAERLAHAWEQQAWDRLSAFVSSRHQKCGHHARPAQGECSGPYCRA